MKKTLLSIMLLLFVTALQAQRIKCAHRFIPYPEKEARATTRTQLAVPTHYTGTKKGLIILMNFQDVQFTDKNKNGKTFDVNEYWNDLANKEGLKAVSGMLVCGSIRDYFRAQSYNEFTLDFDVRGPYTAKNKYSYYGRNKDYGGGNMFDQNPVELIVEAVNACSSEVNFKDYDWDGDGEVDQVYVIYAGHGEASYDDPDLIWPHESEIDNWGIGEVKLQDVKINTYACGNELDNQDRTMGIGTICHEFSHCLGLPDVYNVETGKGVVDYYDIMDAGNYNGDSWYPAGYSSFERYFCGWLNPKRVGSVDEANGLGLQPLTQSPDAAIITREEGSTDYYLIEKRKKESWDTFLTDFTKNQSLSEITLAWHVNYDLARWQDNHVNTDPNNMGLVVVPLEDVPSYATGIQTIEKTDDEAGSWYDLQGRQLQSKPTSKGVYIRNKQKITIR